MNMNKFVGAIFIILLLPIIAHESFGYFGGDMVEQNSFSLSLDKITSGSDIITINDLEKNENMKPRPSGYLSHKNVHTIII